MTSHRLVGLLHLANRKQTKQQRPLPNPIPTPPSPRLPLATLDASAGRAHALPVPIDTAPPPPPIPSFPSHQAPPGHTSHCWASCCCWVGARTAWCWRRWHCWAGWWPCCTFRGCGCRCSWTTVAAWAYPSSGRGPPSRACDRVSGGGGGAEYYICVLIFDRSRMCRQEGMCCDCMCIVGYSGIVGSGGCIVGV